MKGHIELIDIVIVMVMLMAGVSLYTVLMTKMNFDEMLYHEDKTLMDLNEVVEQTALDDLYEIPINSAQLYLLPSVQDNMVPYRGILTKGSTVATLEFKESSDWRRERISNYISNWLKGEILVSAPTSSNPNKIKALNYNLTMIYKDTDGNGKIDATNDTIWKVEVSAE